LPVAHVGPWPRVPAHTPVGTQRWHGHRSPPHAGAVGRPPRSLHASRMRPPPVCLYLALPCSEGEASPLSQLLITPAHCSAPLLLIAFLSREDLPGASPLRPTPSSSSPSRAPLSPRAHHQPLLSRRRAPHRPLTGAPIHPTAISTASPPR
jgi:hypothetical protein